MQWIKTYFSPNRGGVQTINDALNGAVIVTERMPVVLQHSGHSRTVVGYEIQGNGEYNLLVFDPSKELRLPPLNTAPGMQSGIGTGSHTSGNRKLMDRIKDTMFHSINEIKARKRKESPAFIDLTQPTQKRPRSTSGDDVAVADEAGGASHSKIIGTEGQPDRPPSVELEGVVEQSFTKGDVIRRVLNWSRLPMKQIRKKDKYQILYFPLGDPLTDAEKLQRKVVTSLRL